MPQKPREYWMVQYRQSAKEPWQLHFCNTEEEAKDFADRKKWKHFIAEYWQL